jgi:hypothetical protein
MLQERVLRQLTAMAVGILVVVLEILLDVTVLLDSDILVRGILDVAHGSVIFVGTLNF